MMRPIASLLFVALLAAPAACGPVDEKAGGSDEELDVLVRLMTGSFSSRQQAERDPAFRDIRLEMAPIWPVRDDRRWLYVEQATAESLDAPYRQRVYHVLRDDDGALVSAVYEIPEPARFVGAWRDPAIFDVLAPQALAQRTGCAVRLAKDGPGRFTGSTRGRECVSTLRGAAYATSEVVITEAGIESWDRGFDEAGEQVWGSTAGAYVFLRTAG